MKQLKYANWNSKPPFHFPFRSQVITQQHRQPAMSSMNIRFLAVIFIHLIVQAVNVNSEQNPFQYLIEQTNYLIYNSSSIIEDTTSFFPSYDFIIVVSCSRAN